MPRRLAQGAPHVSLRKATSRSSLPLLVRAGLRGLHRRAGEGQATPPDRRPHSGGRRLIDAGAAKDVLPFSAAPGVLPRVARDLHGFRKARRTGSRVPIPMEALAALALVLAFDSHVALVWRMVLMFVRCCHPWKIRSLFVQQLLRALQPVDDPDGSGADCFPAPARLAGQLRIPSHGCSRQIGEDGTRCARGRISAIDGPRWQRRRTATVRGRPPP